MKIQPRPAALRSDTLTVTEVTSIAPVELRRVTVKVPIGDAARAASLRATPSTVIAPGVKIGESMFDVEITTVPSWESISPAVSTVPHDPAAVKLPVANAMRFAICQKL